MADGVGDLHRARVSAAAPAMAGFFVALGGGETGFLPDKEADDSSGQALHEGRTLALRVTRAAQGGKGPRVSARLTADEKARAAAAAAELGGTAPRRLARGPDAALRLVRAHPDAAVETDDAALAARLRAALGRDRVSLRSAPVFDDDLEAEFEALAGPVSPLPGGGRVLVQPTAALTAIDVDAGSVAGARDRQVQARFNAAAVAEAARQIRLRNLAGPVLLDVAGLSRRERERLAAPLARALAPDPLTRLLGLGPLGLFELQRRRVHPPLHEVLGWPPSPLTHGLAALRRAAREAAATPGRPPVALRAAPAVVSALEVVPDVLREAAEAIGRPLRLRADPALAPGLEVLEENVDGR
ncbi:MAG: ribonuclease E/G [Acetobacteraceae bacterium]|nr:ribonuclease E/G [Acetobacteraceae bacterium]